MTKEELQKAVNEGVAAAMSLTERAEAARSVPEPPKAEKLYRVGGLEEVPGTNGIVWKPAKPNKEELSSIAAAISQGTLDIMSNPTMDAREAIERGATMRELRAKIKGE